MSDFTLKQVQSIAEFNPSEQLKKGVLAKCVPMAKLKEFQRKITGYELKPFSGGAKFRNGDILVAKITPCLENGKTAFVDILADNEIAFGSTEFIVLRARNDTNPEFLYYFAISPDFRKRAIECMEGTSGRKRVNENTLKTLELPIPNLKTQKSIAHILSTLDQKIAINNQINAQLEQMAKTLYDYWFVQFDFPNENGKPYKSSGGEMVYNDTLKREIPKGWEVKGLGEIADLYQPQTLSEKDLIEEGKYLVYGANGIIGKYFKYNHNEPVIAIACRGNSCGTINVTQPLSWITGNAMVVKPKLDYMCIDYIKNTLIISNVEKTISGSAQPQITRTNLAPLSFICPSEKLLRAYANKVQAAFELRMKTFEQNQQLTQLRDFLLPMLMNGQVGVGDD
jgi:hypothetical protein